MFEPRYRQLVVDCLADDNGDPEFGVTLIERGSEVGGGDQRTDVGVVARMVRVEALDGGRYASSRSAPGASASTPGCPTTRIRSPTSTTGRTRTPTSPAWRTASAS